MILENKIEFTELRKIDEFYNLNNCDLKLWNVLRSYLDKVILDLNLKESYIKVGKDDEGCFIKCKINGINKMSKIFNTLGSFAK